MVGLQTKAKVETVLRNCYMQALDGTCTKDEQELQPHHVTSQHTQAQSAFLEVVEETKDAEEKIDEIEVKTDSTHDELIGA